MDRFLTVKSGRCHVHRYIRPLLQKIIDGEINPTTVITHRMRPSDAPKSYAIFMKKKDHCEKVVLSTVS